MLHGGVVVSSLLTTASAKEDSRGRWEEAPTSGSSFDAARQARAANRAVWSRRPIVCPIRLARMANHGTAPAPLRRPRQTAAFANPGRPWRRHGPHRDFSRARLARGDIKALPSIVVRPVTSRLVTCA
ncbi:hypothetical protein K523DRAFT_107283 [Schizophyllum commune Tattone D]|nr:hypothetical protein K523DRAFT_107283 [Schizophyllum commune Tattone D]